MVSDFDILQHLNVDLPWSSSRSFTKPQSCHANQSTHPPLDSSKTKSCRVLHIRNGHTHSNNPRKAIRSAWIDESVQRNSATNNNVSRASNQSSRLDVVQARTGGQIDMVRNAELAQVINHTQRWRRPVIAPPWPKEIVQAYLSTNTNPDNSRERSIREHRLRRNSHRPTRSRSCDVVSSQPKTHTSKTFDFAISEPLPQPLSRFHSLPSEETHDPNFTYPVLAMPPAGRKSTVEPPEFDYWGLRAEATQNGLVSPVSPTTPQSIQLNNPNQQVAAQRKTARQRLLHHFYSTHVASVLGSGWHYMTKSYPSLLTPNEKSRQSHADHCDTAGYVDNAWSKELQRDTTQQKKVVFHSADQDWLGVDPIGFHATSETRDAYEDPIKVASAQWQEHLNRSHLLMHSIDRDRNRTVTCCSDRNRTNESNDNRDEYRNKTATTSTQRDRMRPGRTYQPPPKHTAVNVESAASVRSSHWIDDTAFDTQSDVVRLASPNTVRRQRQAKGRQLRSPVTHTSYNHPLDQSQSANVATHDTVVNTTVPQTIAETRPSNSHTINGSNGNNAYTVHPAETSFTAMAEQAKNENQRKRKDPIAEYFSKKTPCKTQSNDIFQSSALAKHKHMTHRRAIQRWKQEQIKRANHEKELAASTAGQFPITHAGRSRWTTSSSRNRAHSANPTMRCKEEPFYRRYVDEPVELAQQRSHMASQLSRRLPIDYF